MVLKAELLAIGRILIPAGLRLPVPLSRNSAGPGAGGLSLFLRIGPSLVRLEAVRRGKAPLVLRERHGRFEILRNGRPVAADVKPVHAGFHAPGQAFVNLHGRCRYHCAFCTLADPPRGTISPERWASLIKQALRAQRVDAVAITTGVPATPSSACRDVARLVASIRSEFPHVPIGVEPYTTRPADLRLLRKAGACELKLNVQCASRSLFDKVCPGLDWDGIWENLRAGVKLFGRGKVCSNIILGLGETDDEVLEAVERLAVLGVAADLRPLKLGPGNEEALARALGQKPRRPGRARLEKLCAAQARLFRKHGIDPSLFRTMCHRCTACDLEPFRDQ